MSHTRTWAASVVAVGWVVMSAAAGAARADDWPQWRGPNRDGISQEKGLLQEWPKNGPKQLWQATDLGGGYSTPAVVGDRLYVMSSKGTNDEFVQALTVNDGKPVWAVRVGKVGNPNQQPAYPAARSTPTVDGDALYALGSDGDLVCLESATGKQRWHKNLRTDFGGVPGTWAYAESPLVDGDAVVCTPGGAQATLVKLDKKTGDVVWKSAVPGGDAAAYASIVVLDLNGSKQYVQFLAKGVVGVDANTGKFLWRFDRTAQGSPANIPTPVVKGNAVYTGASMGTGGLVTLKPSGGPGGAFEAQAAYTNKKLPTAIGGSVLVGDYLYGTTNTVLLCVDFKTGQTKWSDRSVGAASLLYADGRLYLHGENGEVALVEATPAGYREHGRFTPANAPQAANAGEKAWAYPVVANGRLYVRQAGSIWCYAVRAANAS